LVDETHMTKHNGKPIAPPVAVARNLHLLAHDVVELVELQSAMAKLEMQDWWKRLITPGVLLVVSVIVALGCIPIFLFSAAHGLAEAASMSLWLALLIVAAVSALLAGVLALVGWKKLVACQAPLRQSKQELGRNLRWIKATLKHSAPPSDVVSSWEQ